MIWAIILVILIGCIGWVLISPLTIEIDTRIPGAQLKWKGVGDARLWYEREWWLSFRILFFRKKIRLSAVGSGRKLIKRATKKQRPQSGVHGRHILARMIRIIKTFRVKTWHVALDTGDYTVNARLYPVNFARPVFGHVHINFVGENYLVIIITNRPWKIISAYWR